MAEGFRKGWVLAAVLFAGRLWAGEVFYDYADVTSVRPVLERAAPSAGLGECRPGVRSGSGGREDATGEGDGIATLVEALRNELDRQTETMACQPLPDGKERIVGYRVTYRYGDSEYIRMMERDPGARMRVRVRVDPGP